MTETAPRPKVRAFFGSIGRVFRALGFVIVVPIFVLVVFAILDASYPDYTPRAKLSEALLIASSYGKELSSGCTPGVVTPAPTLIQSIAAAKTPAGSVRESVVSAQKLAVDSNENILLEITLNEIRHGNPWSKWFAAIPAGSVLVFEGKCSGPQQFEWRVVKFTGSVKYLPLHFREQLL